MNWKRLFQSHILDRGYNYYCDDAIENLEIHEDMIVADVIGNDDYEVEICLSGEEVKEMYCSCPYAAGGQNCKHMAAVLFAWEEERNQKDTAREEEGMNRGLFLNAHTQATYDKKKRQ